jgi:hypothetical protein
LMNGIAIDVLDVLNMIKKHVNSNGLRYILKPRW